MKKILVAELLMNAGTALAADDGRFTSDKAFFLEAMPAALDAGKHCGVLLDKGAILANAERIGLAIEEAERRYPVPYYGALGRHISLVDNLLRVQSPKDVCRYLISTVDDNRLWKGWRHLP